MVEKVIAFSDWQNLKAARRRVEFTNGPDVDKMPSNATVHPAFIASDEQRIVALVARLWGPKAKPEHWSGIHLIERGQKLDKGVEYKVMHAREGAEARAGNGGLRAITRGD